ncbi:MAG: acetaldehyde dehydrogenase (acetylating) [Candidatus Ancillula sp.]|jgi:acetaldehyde dehydrogenase|nr:acetaldehyde dehydrogenase (acetylating) [Candidatus Ancillula sp.]
MQKIRCAILGTGNIGTDLLMKISRSDYLEVGIFVGRRADSPGILFAKKMGITTSTESVDAIVKDPDCCQIVFDCTSAAQHIKNAPIFERLGKFVVDLTPAQVGKFCVPALNLEESLNANNVNMITCAGQATIPIINAILSSFPDGERPEYVETVSVIASKSAGIGTRDNIDEFTQTTKNAIMKFSNVPEAKSIIILNPAEPPIRMHNTIYIPSVDSDIELIRKNVDTASKKIREYASGFKTVFPPEVQNGTITTMIEVEGSGDFLPRYSGNLDIINCAAVNVAENWACRCAEVKAVPSD